MAGRLESLQKIIFNATKCFQTLATGERVYFTFKRGVVKDFPSGGGMGPQPHVYITPENGQGDAGWYPVRALWFEMPDGEIVK